jgi:tetratricopeptide (TPR) repeat protein
MRAWLFALFNLESTVLFPPTETFPKAKEAALKALELDDTLAEAHTSLAYIKAFYEWDWSGAERESQRAIALNPSSADGHAGYGTALLMMGRSEEAVAELKRAVEFDSLSLLINWLLEQHFTVHGSMTRPSNRS